MSLGKARRLYISVLGLALSGLLVDRLVFSRPGESGPGADALIAGVESALGVSGAQASPVGLISVAQRLAEVARAQGVEGGPVRDAFSAPWKRGPIAGAGPDEPGEDAGGDVSGDFAQRHELSAVLLGGGGGCAVISGRLVRVGETLDGLRLLRVDEDRAVFGDGPTRAVLTLAAPQVKGSRN